MKSLFKTILIDIFLIFGISVVSHATPVTPPYYNYIYTTATTCNSLTSGKATMMCVQQTDHTLWQCIPNAGFLGTCNTSGEWVEVGGGGGTPAGSTGYIQLNTNGVFGATSNLSYVSEATTGYIPSPSNYGAGPSSVQSIAADSSGNIYTGSLSSNTMYVYTNPNSNLGTSTVLTIGGGGTIPQVVYDPVTNLVYAILLNETNVYLYSINPSTLAITLKATGTVANTEQGSFAVPGDGNAYGVIANTSNCTIYKVPVAGGSFTTTNWSGVSQCDAALAYKYSSGTTEAYLFGGNSCTVAKLNTSAMTFSTSGVTGANGFCSETEAFQDIDSTHGYLYIGTEGTGSTLATQINSSNLSMSTFSVAAGTTYYMYTDPTGNLWMVSGQNVIEEWPLANISGTPIVYYSYPYIPSPNKMVYNGTNYFVTSYPGGNVYQTSFGTNSNNFTVQGINSGYIGNNDTVGTGLSGSLIIGNDLHLTASGSNNLGATNTILIGSGCSISSGSQGPSINLCENGTSLMTANVSGINLFGTLASITSSGAIYGANIVSNNNVIATNGVYGKSLGIASLNIGSNFDSGGTYPNGYDAISNADQNGNVWMAIQSDVTNGDAIFNMFNSSGTVDSNGVGTKDFELTAGGNDSPGGIPHMWILGNAGIGTSTTTGGELSLGAGTANLPPLLFTSGTNLTTPTNGAMEFNGTHLYFDIGSTRYQIDQQSGGSMTYPGAGIANSTGSAWGTSYTTSGSGTVLALVTSPTFVTPTLGAASGTSITLSASTSSTSSSTGAVIDSGGLGVSGAVFLGTATSTLCGSLELCDGIATTAGFGVLNSSAPGPGAGGGILAISNNGSTTMSSGYRLGYYLGTGYNGSGITNSSGMEIFAEGTWSSSSTPSYITMDTTPTGSTSRTKVLIVDQNGGVGIGDGTNAPTSGGLSVGSSYQLNITSAGALSTSGGISSTRISRRYGTSSAPGATPSLDTDNYDVYSFTGVATSITSMTTNLTGTPNTGDFIEIIFTDAGTAETITWGASFSSSGTNPLPLTTVISTPLRVFLEWSGSVWVCVGTS